MSDTNQPQMWTRPPNYIGKTWEGWFVFLDRNRDSQLLTSHNFETALRELETLSTDDAPDGDATVRAVSENHWACGWLEWIAIHESNAPALAKARELGKRLDDYPILDEESYSERESEAADEIWRGCYNVRERAELLERCGDLERGVSIFAARRPYIPEGADGVRDVLTSQV